MSKRTLAAAVAFAAVLGGLLLAIGVGSLVRGGDRGDESLSAFVREHGGLNRHAQALAVIREKLEAGGEVATGPAQEAYENRALPRTTITYRRARVARNAYRRIVARTVLRKRGTLTKSARARARRLTLASAWQELGPITPVVPAPSTNTGRETTESGRVTALALGPTCVPGNCRLLVAAAGGGIWRTGNALAAKPVWSSSSAGLASNSTGSLAFDPTNPNVVYLGTGEPNGSADSEAGVGLYKSIDGGSTWSLVSGSVPVSKDRSIGAIAVDPANSQHIYIGTALARHGMAAVHGGRQTPPGAPTLGIYESTNGGASFSLVFSRPADTRSTDPNSATGGDYFRGGVSKIVLNRTGLTAAQKTRVYASFFDYGLYRSSPADEGGDASFKQVFASAGGGLVANSIASRTEFSLAPHNGQLRVYLGDAGSGPADFYRVDNANVPASTLDPSGTNSGWTKLSSSANGTPGFGSYDYCGGQCSYDMPVYSPPGQPNVVYLGGQMQYDEIFPGDPIPFRSNGRTVQRSTDAGVHFTDMTNDSRSPALGMHPDQHDIVASASYAFFGSDGGVVRIPTSADSFTDTSGQCDFRGLSGADLADCRGWLSSIPKQIDSLNDGLATLQFQSLSLNPQDPLGDLLGGTQDNGTFAFTGSPTWIESISGDGGQSGTDAANSDVRMHTYFSAQGDVNFHGTLPTGWDWFADPLLASRENASFYVPLIADPKVSGSWFVGLQHVWRTQDNAGDQAFLDEHCNEFTGDFKFNCGDWVPLAAGQKGDLTSRHFGLTRGGHFVVATERASTDTSTLWAATRLGRVFISKNADAPAAQVDFTRIDDGESASPKTPGRFVSGVAIDPANPNHAWVSYSGYNAYTPATPGHVFEVTYNPAVGTASWTDRSYNLGDEPIIDVARDDNTGDLYAATDFGVLRLPNGSSVWQTAASGLPPTAVYGLTISSSARVLYAATHGRGAWKLGL
jgi:hypothetical protein